MEEFSITKIRSGISERVSVFVSEEVPLTIEVNGNEISTMLCSPSDLENLVIGFLYTSGFIYSPDSIKNIVIDRDQWKATISMEADGLPDDMVFKRIYTSGCGKGILFHNPIDLMQRDKIEDNLKVHSNNIENLMRCFLKKSEEHAKTRGVHSCALVKEGEIIIFRDDIGRHNALDKIIGAALIDNHGFHNQIILTSGRISSEIISKIIRCGFPVIIAAGAPTNQAVKIAQSLNLTIIGFVRGKSMNVYSGEQRIVCP